MSHHFDTTIAQSYPKLDLNDVYVFPAETAGATAFVLTVNNTIASTAPPIGPHPFASEGAYQFHIATGDNLKSGISLVVRFSNVGDKQRFALTLFNETAPSPDAAGSLLGEAFLGETISLANGGRAWAGIADDPFWGNGLGLDALKHELIDHGRLEVEKFDTAQNLFQGSRVGAIAIELPNQLLSDAIQVWATTSRKGETGKWSRVNRQANPLLLHAFFDDQAAREAFNASNPWDDADHDREIKASVRMAIRAAKSAPDADAYADQVARFLLPDVLRYEINAPAGFTFAGRNGRRMQDDVMDVMMTLYANLPMRHQAPDPKNYQARFPYVKPIE